MKKLTIKLAFFIFHHILCNKLREIITNTLKLNMKKITTSLLVFVGLSIHTFAQQKEGIDISLMDQTVRPQDDFYNYVSGNWMKTAKIPSDKPTWGSFNQLAEDTDNNSLLILNNILTETFPAGSEGRKIQDLYASYTNLSKRNKEGIQPIASKIKQIDAIKTMADLQHYLISVTKDGDNTLYGWGVYADLKDSNMNAVYLGEATLGLGRDYYQKENEKNTEALTEYQRYIASMLKELGYKNADKTAQSILAFEKKIANTYLTNEQVRDATLQYNPATMAELAGLVKNVNLPEYLKKVGVNTDQVIIGELNYYKNFDQLFQTKHLPVIKDYLKFHLINESAPYLSEKLDDMRFNFYGKYLRGQQEQRALNKRAFQVIDGTLGEAFGKLYVEKYFPAADKAKVLD